MFMQLWVFLFQTLLEDTHLQLKKNVYQNYGQFIDTAKEISFLESEMYQLAHMITEQRNLLHELMDASVLGDKVKIDIRIINIARSFIIYLKVLQRTSLEKTEL